MFIPPTMLPHSLRVLVDPPFEPGNATDNLRTPIVSSPRSRPALVRRTAEAAGPPCEDRPNGAFRPLVGRTKACTE